MTTGKTIALPIWTFVDKVLSLFFNALSVFVIAFLPRSKCVWVSWRQSPSSVILEPKKIKPVTASTSLFLKKKLNPLGAFYALSDSISQSVCTLKSWKIHFILSAPHLWGKISNGDFSDCLIYLLVDTGSSNMSLLVSCHQLRGSSIHTLIIFFFCLHSFPWKSHLTMTWNHSIR